MLNNKRNFLLLVIVILLAVGVAGATIYFLTKKTPSVPEGPKQEISEQPVPQEPKEPIFTQSEEGTSTQLKENMILEVSLSELDVDVSNWGIYRNEEYEFTMMYPPNPDVIENGIEQENHFIRLHYLLNQHDPSFPVWRESLRIVITNEPLEICIDPEPNANVETTEILIKDKSSSPSFLYRKIFEDFAMGGKGSMEIRYSTYHNDKCFRLWGSVEYNRLPPSCWREECEESEIKEYQNKLEKIKKKELKILERALLTFSFPE